MKTHDLVQTVLGKDKPRPPVPSPPAPGAAAAPAGDPSTVREAVSAVLATAVLAVVVSGVYPAAVWGLGQGLFHHRANGSLIVAADGRTVLGSELLGQNFAGKQYFNPRPSAAGAAGYDPTASGGTNLGPTSDKLVHGQHKTDADGKPVSDPSNFDGVTDLVVAYRAANGLRDTDPVPADAVTRSGSGLDPHISVANALWQLPRVARERGRPPEEVRRLLDGCTEGRDLGVFGEPRVNTVLLNLALDGRLPGSAAR